MKNIHSTLLFSLLLVGACSHLAKSEEPAPSAATPQASSDREEIQLKYEGVTLGYLIPDTLTQSKRSTKPLECYVCFSLENNSAFKIASCNFTLQYQQQDRPKAYSWTDQDDLDLSGLRICSVFDKYSSVSLDVKDKLYYFIRIGNMIDFQKYPSRIMASLSIKIKEKHYKSKLIYSSPVIEREQKGMYFSQPQKSHQSDLLNFLHYEDRIISIAFCNNDKRIGKAIDFYCDPTAENYNLNLSLIDKQKNKELGFLGMTICFLNENKQFSPKILLPSERFTYKGYLNRIYRIQDIDALGEVPQEELNSKALLLRGKYSSSKEFYIHDALNKAPSEEETNNRVVENWLNGCLDSK